MSHVEWSIIVVVFVIIVAGTWQWERRGACAVCGKRLSIIAIMAHDYVILKCSNGHSETVKRRRKL